MAIATYSDLVVAIQDWMMDRSDLAEFAPDFITLAEQVFNFGVDGVPPLRVRDMEAVTDLSPTSNVYTLPSDYLQFRRVTEKVTPRRPLEYIEPMASDHLYAYRQSGLSNHFTIIGDSLYTFPLSTNDVELTYFQTIPALTADAPTNWLLTKAPSLYLRAALTQAAEFIKDSGEMAKQAAITATLVNGMNRADMMANYARAGLTLRGITP